MACPPLECLPTDRFESISLRVAWLFDVAAVEHTDIEAGSELGESVGDNRAWHCGVRAEDELEVEPSAPKRAPASTDDAFRWYPRLESAVLPRPARIV